MRNNWFSEYYSEISKIFLYDFKKDNFREFNIDLNKYAGELFLEINTKIQNKLIKNNKQEILEAVSQFVERKVRFRKQFLNSNRYLRFFIFQR